MTTPAKLIANFLETDLKQVSTESHKNLESWHIYQGQRMEKTPGHLELLIKPSRRININSKNGSPRKYPFELHIRIGGTDDPEEYTLATQVLEVADVLVERYDGGSRSLPGFKTGIPTLRFERAECTRREVTMNPQNNTRKVIVDLSLTIWE